MDPCPFVRILVGNLAFRTRAEGYSSSLNSDFCRCKIKLKGFPPQLANIQLICRDSDVIESRIHACYSFTKSDFDKLVEKFSKKSIKTLLKVEIYMGIRSDSSACGRKVGRLLGCVLVPLDLKAVESSVWSNKNCVIENRWVAVGGGVGELCLNVRAEPDPRFVFQFDAEPECSPQVFQVNGNLRQPVFTCKFGFRSSGERNLRSEQSNRIRGCFSTAFATGDKETLAKERKGWSITIHDLSGAAVAVASMVTPFVASPGTKRVKRSNPGAWLILRPENGTWKPWGRLEAWRERIAGGDHLGYRFELIPEGSIGEINLASSVIKAKKGGKFSIDIMTGATPITSPNSSFDLSSVSVSGSELGSVSSSGNWAHLLYRGFVMSSTVQADGKRSSKPMVEVGVQHVTCTEDAAAFVALAAAMDLSMDACRLFSKKLRKELRQPIQE